MSLPGTSLCALLWLLPVLGSEPGRVAGNPNPESQGTAGQGTAGQGTAGQGTDGQGTDGQGTAGQGTAGRGLRERANQALALDPRTLPFAAEGRWFQWGPKDEIPEALRRDLAAGMRAYTAGDFAAGLAFFYGLLEREPEFPPALYQGALCHFRLRRYGDAALLLERFVQAAPQEIGATQALGHCYYSLGDFARARDHYEKVVAKSPKSVEALRGLALSVMRLGDDGRALVLLDSVLELRPDHADAHAWRSQILFDAGRSEEALVHAERARTLEPWEPRPWFLLSRIYGDLGRDEEAEAARERFDLASRREQQVRQQEGILLHDPARVDAWMQLMALQRAGQNRAGLRESAARLTALGPAGGIDLRAALMLTDAFEWLGDVPRAKTLAAYAETLAGTDRDAWTWLADFYRRVVDVAGAERATKALAKAQ